MISIHQNVDKQCAKLQYRALSKWIWKEYLIPTSLFAGGNLDGNAGERVHINNLALRLLKLLIHEG